MTELEKLHAGLEYDMWAPEIDALKPTIMFPYWTVRRCVSGTML